MYIFEKIAEDCIPNYTCTIRPTDKPWMTPQIRNAMRRRDRLHAKRKRRPCPETNQAYKTARNLVVSLIKESKAAHDAKLLSTLSDPACDSKTWWKCMKQLDDSRTKPAFSAPLMQNNKVITDSKQKADMFNKFFASQTSIDQTKVWDPGEPPVPRVTIDDPTFTDFEVFKILSTLKTNKATGPDGIGNKLLKEAAPAICSPLCRLFNRSVTLQTFPSAWKLSHVVPLHKKDSVTDPNNYRPVSLLPCISKALERLMYNHINTFLTENSLITPKQSGFRPGDSTVNQLIFICDKIAKTLDCGNEIRAIFLDFSKAFDKVWHHGLLYKLKRSGITGKTLHWLQSYLSNRHQRVTLGAASSNLAPVEAGVPQGSVLGPLLFLVYINDLITDLESDVFVFADDTSLFENVDNDPDICTAVLNRDLKRIENWCDKWLFIINLSKTKSILFTRKRNPSPELLLFLKNTILHCVKSHKHLGILFTRTLDWGEHILSISTKKHEASEFSGQI
jgi:hypothetical protein